MSKCDNCTVEYKDFYSENIYTWCTNCGNYGIAAATKRALVEEQIQPKDTLMCFDIGCNGNGADKIEGYRYHGLHGRVISFASGAALANPELTVIASGGDGGTISEGIGHFVHAIRSDYNMVFLLHNNANYGLTTGQASATTRQDVPMNSSPDGVSAETVNVLKFAMGLNPSFLARTFSGDVKQMTEIIRAGIRHNGFSIIEILQSCPSYNKATPHEWYQERVYDVFFEKDYDNSDPIAASRVIDDLDNRIATGVLYQDSNRPNFLEKQKNREGISTTLVSEVQRFDITELKNKYR
ncbi:2-oxoacid:ferredoxin oxidoreductase subunit beta [Candidatus Dojkabacteria bacterium]|uniref:2-oxoacid:ferredoxin oxidoreductase subunit beta n=1 Tax=Candidatus Dojkabacteria bacterium TaxID=2099670 RepID=A0A955RIV9_9BACT|nr:2-oxoacid:ferredoxin oxidoreductase subunit beta [Candidatus Dojkabacteria bacterium]